MVKGHELPRSVRGHAPGNFLNNDILITIFLGGKLGILAGGSFVLSNSLDTTCLECKQQLSGRVNYRDFRGTGPQDGDGNQCAKKAIPLIRLTTLHARHSLHFFVVTALLRHEIS